MLFRNFRLLNLGMMQTKFSFLLGLLVAFQEFPAHFLLKQLVLENRAAQMRQRDSNSKSKLSPLLTEVKLHQRLLL